VFETRQRWFGIQIVWDKKYYFQNEADTNRKTKLRMKYQE